MIIILWSGISGISSAYHLSEKNKDSIIFEKNNFSWWLCSSFEIKWFRFDNAIHLSFTKNKYVKELFKKSCTYHKHSPDAYNYHKWYWIKHPVQNNIYPLEIKDKIEIIKSFIEKKSFNEINNYEDWLYETYWEYLTKEFHLKYTKKYWTLDAKELTTKWIWNRMYKPKIDEILYWALSNNTPNTYYANEMRYPKIGWYQSFLKKMIGKCNIQLNKEAILIDPIKKYIKFKDWSKKNYTELISSIPLPEIIKIIKNCPINIKQASNNLSRTSVALISLGINKPNISKHLWFYIYDEDILPARIYSSDLKSNDNTPSNYSWLQCEIYFSKNKPLKKSSKELIEHVIKSLENMKICKKSNIIISDFRVLKYGNIIFDKKMEYNRKIIHSYLDNLDIKYIGRFGEWDYLWSDQSLMSWKNIINKIKI